MPIRRDQVWHVMKILTSKIANANITGNTEGKYIFDINQ